MSESTARGVAFADTEAAQHWAFESSRILPDCLGLELRQYRHKTYGTGAILGNVGGPICSVVMAFATAEVGDKGRTHCLEHMCFMESKSYPRGVLDMMASRCGGNGTNASTDSDNTQYTFDVAGSAGLHKVLPVFVNHTLVPKLTQQAFLTEVFHVNGKGENQGTVYSEMIGRTNSEGDKMWNSFLLTLFGKDTAYGNNCGGEPDDIATLKVEELREYHSQVYTTDNLDVIVTGQFDDASILSTLHESLHYSVEKDGAKVACQDRPFTQKLPTPPPPAKLDEFDVIKKGGLFAPTRRVVMFPSEDDSVGSFMFGQKVLKGDLADVVTLTAADVALRFLSDLSSSPLNKEFVEIPEPIASSISCDCTPAVEPYFMMEFSGVPYIDDNAGGAAAADKPGEASPEEDAAEEDDEEGEEGEGEEGDEDESTAAGGVSPYFGEKNLLMDKLIASIERVVVALRDTSSPGENEMWGALQKSLAKERVSLQEDFEDSPHQFVAGCILPEAVFKKYPHESGEIPFGALADQSSDFEALKSKDQVWWADFIDAMILKGLKLCRDGKPGGAVEIRTVPSQALAEKNDLKVKKIEKENKKRFGANLKRLQKMVDDAEVYNKVSLSDEIRGKFPPHINLGDVADIERQVTRHTSRPVEIVEVSLATSFVMSVSYFNIKRLSPEVRRYAYLFTELLMESDADGKPYGEIVARLDDELVSYNSSIGRFSRFMSIGTQPTCLSVYLISEPGKAEHIPQWLDLLLHKVQFTAERVKTHCKNLLSDISDNVRDADHVLSHSMQFAYFTPDSQHCLSNPFAQRDFLKRCIKNPVETIARLNEILSHIASSPEVEVSCLVAAADSGVRSQVMGGVESAILSARPAGTAALPKLYPSMKWGGGAREHRTTSGRSFVVGVGGVDAAAISIDVPVEELSAGETWALRLLCECINAGEGDLCLAIRGKGLAYGAGVYFNTYQGSLSLDIWECTNIKPAMEAALEVVSSIGDPESDSTVLSDFNISNCISALVYAQKSKRATPSDVIDTTSTSCMKQIFSPEEDRQNELLIHSVTKEHLIQAYEKYVKRLLGHSALVAGVATSPQQVDPAAKALAALYKQPVTSHKSLKEMFSLADQLVSSV